LAYVALGVMVSDRKQCGGGGHSYLGFIGHRKSAGELLSHKLSAGGGLLRWASVKREEWGSNRRIQ
jgi:hypothetical protein